MKVRVLLDVTEQERFVIAKYFAVAAPRDTSDRRRLRATRRLGEQAAARGDGDIDRQVLHFLQCERLGLGDLFNRLGFTSLHRGFQIGSGVQPQPRRFLTGMCDDVFGFLQRIALTALV